MMLRMSARLVNIDRETPMLLPPDLRDWVEQDDLAHAREGRRAGLILCLEEVLAVALRQVRDE